MTTIAFPATPAIQSATWRYVRPTQVNTSGWTGGRQVLASNRGWWEASIAIPPIVGEKAFQAWRGFIAETRGAANDFQVPYVAANQTVWGGYSPKINGAGQTGRDIITDGWPISRTVLRKGQAVNIGSQLCILTADLTTNGSGQATISIADPVRNATTDNADIEYQRPYCLMYLAEDAIYSTAPGMVFGLTLELSESL